MQRLPLANREKELESFAGMVAGTTGERILLLEAGGGIGKTTLMAEFVRHCHGAEMPCVPIDLKGDPGLHEVLARLCDGLGWDDFPTFTARVEGLAHSGSAGAADAAFEHIDREDYNWAAIRNLMVAAFTIDDLRAFCFDRPAFRPALNLFTEGAKLPTLAMDVIKFCAQRHGKLDSLLLALREERFEQYKQYYAQIYRVEAQALPQRGASRAAGAGIGRAEIRDALRAADEGDQAARRGALTRALFDDLGTRPGRVAILVDTCEQAGPELGAWLAESFLAHTHRTTNLVVVVAGRQVPETSLGWEACCQHHPLSELREPNLWQAYAKQIGAALPSPDWIAGFCDLFDGHPLKMMEALARYMPGGQGR